MQDHQPANGHLSSHIPNGSPALKPSTTISPPLHVTIIQRTFSALIGLIFITTAVCLHLQQWLGTPLYILNRQWYNAWQSKVKESTALLLIGLNQLRAPTSARVSGDSSVKGQIRLENDGKIRLDFPSRMIMIANHQIYTDWIFFWWTAYICNPRGHHGHFFVILKSSLQKIPIIGSGLTFFSWIFLSRRWEADQVNFLKGISHLASSSSSSSSQENPRSDPMWLLLFPEGTNMSRNARKASQKWSEKSGTPDLKHVILPRSRGLQTCLQGLEGSVEWLYDCTIAYEGIPLGEYGQEVHSLKNLYIEGTGAPRAHMYWRRFAVKEIPFEETKEFEGWVLQRWIEKNELLEQFQQNGVFPAEGDWHVTADVEIQSSLEVLQILGGVVAAVVVWWVGKFLCDQTSSLIHAMR